MPRRPDRSLIYEVALRWLNVVAAQSSLFTPERAVWTKVALQGLHGRITGAPDFGPGGFQAKLRQQAEAEGPAGKLLAAEAMFVFQLKDSSGLAVSKRAQVESLLQGLVPPVDVPDDLAAALKFGLAKYGPGRTRSLYDYLFVLRLAENWQGLRPDDRASLLQDPWAFRDLLRSIDVPKAVFAREATQHLVHPETFDAVASLSAKRRIVRVLGGVQVSRSTDLDRELLALRGRLEADGSATPGFSFYDPDVRPRWDPPKSGGGHDLDDEEDDDEPGATTEAPGAVRIASRLRLADVEAAAEQAGLRVDCRVLAALVAALESGKHVVLTGAPGTAKTTLAELVARVARKAGRCDGHVLATATADWSTYETVGGYRPTPEGGLFFEPGIVLEALAGRRWLVLDEMNRANTDRALGPLFTVLSGQAVVLPVEQDGRPVRVRPASTEPDDRYRDYVVPSDWRIIATTNVLDRALLFDLSFALMRRFAFIDVAAPDLEGYRELLHEAVAEQAVAVGQRAEQLVEQLLPLRELRPLGPALFMDAVQFVAAYVVDRPQAADRELLLAAFFAYFLPQFEGLDGPGAGALRDVMVKAAGKSSRADVEVMLEQTLQVRLPRQADMPRGDGVDGDGHDDLDDPTAL